jgi:hypothetical protein
LFQRRELLALLASHLAQEVGDGERAAQ